MDSKKLGMLVCTIFDLGAAQHGPVFQSMNYHTMWRAVEQMLQNSPIPKSEFLVFVHGEIDPGKVRDCFQPLLEPSVFSVESKAVVALEGVYRMIEEVSQ